MLRSAYVPNLTVLSAGKGIGMPKRNILTLAEHKADQLSKTPIPKNIKSPVVRTTFYDMPTFKFFNPEFAKLIIPVETKNKQNKMFWLNNELWCLEVDATDPVRILEVTNEAADIYGVAAKDIADIGVMKNVNDPSDEPKKNENIYVKIIEAFKKVNDKNGDYYKKVEAYSNSKNPKMLDENMKNVEQRTGVAMECAPYDGKVKSWANDGDTSLIHTTNVYTFFIDKKASSAPVQSQESGGSDSDSKSEKSESVS